MVRSLSKPRIRQLLFLLLGLCIVVLIRDGLLGSAEFQQQQPAAAGQKPVVVKQDESEVHITHIFGTYGKPSGVLGKEMKLVQASWKRAADQAKVQAGLVVEFLDFTFPGDVLNSPDFAKQHDLKLYIDDVRKGRVSTIGEPLALTTKLARGSIIVRTNTDIGLFPDFYIKAWNWAKRDYTSREVQQEAAEKAAKYLSFCAMKYDVGPADHLEGCVEDAKVFFMHSGGDATVFEQIKFELVLMGLRKMKVHSMASNQVLVNKGQQLLELADKARAKDMLAQPNWQESVGKATLNIPDTVLENLKPPKFAGTITRLDFEANTQSSGTETDLDKFLQLVKSKGMVHPGNDCFVFDRDNIHPSITKMMHPPGLRPYGMWIALTYVDAGLPFRRISGTREDPWTFHVGKGLWGLKTDAFMDKIQVDPEYSLFLVSHYDLVSGGAIKRSFQGSEFCQRTQRPWRMNKMCLGQISEYCSGMIRLGCLYNVNFLLRDQKWYVTACQSILATGKQLAQPMCDFCKFAIDFSSKTRKSSAKCAATNTELKYCEGFRDQC